MSRVPRPRFRPPPGWPTPPPGWVPPADWSPPPSWPSAPRAWAFWTDDDAPTPPVAVRRRGYQAGWLAVYWSAAGLSILLLVVALVTGDVPAQAYLVLVTGTLATLLAALMSSHLRLRRIPDVAFDSATTTGRTIALAWLLFALVLVVLAVETTGAGAQPAPTGSGDVAIAATDSITAQILGVAALVGVLGPGYAEYRKALAELRPPAQ